MRDHRRSSEERPTRGPRRGRRVLLVAVTGALTLLVAFSFVFLLAPIRESFLRHVLQLADDALPGDLEVNSARWPHLSVLVLEGVQWRTSATVLLRADSIRVELALGALRSRDLEIREARLQSLSLDLPGLKRAFRGPSPRAAPHGEPWFPRPGALVGLPSVALHRVVLRADSIRLLPDLTMHSVALDAGFDLRRNRPPQLQVETLRAIDPLGTWRVDTLALDVDLETGQARGKGQGRIAPGWPLFFDLSSTGPDDFALRLTGTPNGGPPDSLGLVAQVGVVRRGLQVDSLQVKGLLRTPETQELRRLPGMAPYQARLPRFDTMLLRLQGVVAFRPEPGVHMEIRVQPDSWFRSGTLTFESMRRDWKLDLRDLSVADITLDGALQSTSETLQLSASLGVAGPRWQELLPRPVAPLEDARLQARLHLQRRHGSGQAQIELAASGGTNVFKLDSLHVLGTVGLKEEHPSRLQIQARAGSVHAGLGAELFLGPTIRLRCSPLFLDGRAVPASRLQTLSDKPCLRYEPAARRLRVEDFRIDGTAGRGQLQGDLVLGDSGEFRAHFDWPQFPELLASSLKLTEARSDSLRQRWHLDAPFHADILGRFAAGGDSGQASLHLQLPGPRTLAPLLPGPLHALEGGPCRVAASLVRWEAAATSQYRLAVDASPTAWLDSLQIRLEGTSETVHVRRALLELDGARLTMDGDVHARELDLRGSLDVASAALLQRLFGKSSPPASPTAESGPAPEAAPSLQVRGDLSLSGTREAPQLQVHLEGGTFWGPVALPHWTSELELQPDMAVVHVNATEGPRLFFLQLDRLQGRMEMPRTPDPSPSLWLLAQGPGIELEQSVRIAADSSRSIDVQSLRLRLGNDDLENRGPFRIRWDEAHLQLESLLLEGSLGRIEASGTISSRHPSFGADVRVALPAKPAALRLPDDLWPRQIELELRAQGPDSLTAHGKIHGLRLAGGAEPTLALQLWGGAHRTESRIVLGDSLHPFVQAQLDVPFRLQLYPPTALFEEGALETELRFADLPFVVRTTRSKEPPGPEDILRLAGYLHLEGTMASPSGFAHVVGAFPDTPNLVGFRLESNARLGRSAVIDSLWAAATWPEESAKTSEEQLQMQFRLLQETATLVHGGLLSPLRLSLRGGSLQLAAGDRLAAWIRTNDIPLSTSNPFLPPGITLSGAASLSLNLEGPLQDPALDGRLQASDGQLTLRDGSTVTWKTTTRLEGSARAPRLKGTIEVISGVLKVPEPPKNLHPVSGQALLLESRAHADSSRRSETASPTSIDSTGLAGATLEGMPAPAPPGILQRADLDVEIRMGNGFAVRGRGLDLELTGQLRIRQQEGKPRIVGELNVVRGTYSLLGRTFNLDRGKVIFHGDDASPELDIQLSTSVSGTRIRVLVNGTTDKPQLTLSSDPEMEQTDIIALLTLGKTFDQLNDQESTLLRDRATAVVLSMGATALQENVANELGIDVVQYRSTGGAPTRGTSREGEAGSLAFGKYLNPRLLISYAYSLDRSADDLVSLEYFLKSELRIETLVSVGGQTGMGFVWTKEY